MKIIAAFVHRCVPILACVCAVNAHAVCHVKADASGAGNGTSWSDAYTDLQSALQEATCNEVWVAKGVYKPTSSITDRTASFSIRPGLKVYGGFIGNETSAARADPGANRTVLSGDIDDNDMVDADGVTRLYTDARGGNSYTIVLIDGTTAAGSIGSDTVLDGFAITGGTGTVGQISDSIAGGLYCNANGNGRTCNPRLVRLWVAGNLADTGGGLFNRAENGGVANPVVRAVTFSGNRGAKFGGAIANYGFGGTASPDLTNVTFNGNTSQGGAVFNQAALATGSASPTLRKVTFAGNSGPLASAVYTAVVAGGQSTTTLDEAVLWDAAGAPEVGYYLATSASVVISNSVVARGCPGGQTTCQNVTSADPLLGPLQDNGGATPTLLPGVGSSALDKGDPATCGTAPYDIDQRGIARPQGPACDLGAVELRQAQFAVGVSGPGSVTAAATGSTAASGGIVGCDEDGAGCIAGYAIEPAATTVVVDLAPAAHAHLVSVVDTCGAGGASIGVLAGSTYTIAPYVTDCVALAAFAADTHVIGGQVSGLAGGGLSLDLNGSESLAITANGAFTFATPLQYEANYTVTVATSPSQPTQTCTVSKGSGAVGDTDVVDIQVTCVTNTYTVGGTVSGLLGSGLTLQLGGETLPVAGNGTFVFQTQIASAATYAVTVSTPPSQPPQVCMIANASGTVVDTNVVDVAVTCQALVPHLVLSVDDGRDYLRYGRIVDYVVTLSNDGDGAASNVSVTSTLSAAFDTTYAQWQCFGGGGGVSCAATGTGALTDTVSLPPHRSVSWLVSVPVRGDATDADASFAVNVVGATPETATDADILVILRDGFDVPYADGASVVEPDSTAILDGDASHAFALSPPSSQLIDNVLVLHAQDEEVHVQRVGLGGAAWVRLMRRDANGDERVSGWAEADAGARLGVGSVEDRGVRWLLLEGARSPLQLGAVAH